jgi:hypothetical protein
MYVPHRRSGPRLGLLVGLLICCLFGLGGGSAVAQITITGGPTGLTNDPTLTFEFQTAIANPVFQCSVDNEPPFPAEQIGNCHSPMFCTVDPMCGGSYTPMMDLPDGPHTFAVRDVALPCDGPGQPPCPRAELTFTVDTVAPDTVILSGPPGLTNNSVPTFTFSSNDPNATYELNATFRCRHDNTDFVPCGSPYTLPTLGDGDHSFDVYAVDPAGNSDLSPAHAAFMVDTVAPVTRVTGGPVGTVGDPTPRFIFSANERTSEFECRIDDAGFTACGSPFTPTSALSDGNHIFEVRAIDLAGNRGPAGRLSFTVARTGGGGEPGPGEPGPGEQELPPPKVGRSVNLSVARGRVRVREPGSGSSVVLTGDSQVRAGSQIDARRGTIRLTSARNASGATQSAEFSLGVFKVLQSRGRRPSTDAQITRPKCARPSAAPARNRLRMKTLGAAAAEARVLRDRPSAARRRKARWRVKGRYSIAASRATDWTTIERCARTTTVVHEGRVSVIDRVRRRTVSLGPGERYTARARR